MKKYIYIAVAFIIGAGIAAAVALGTPKTLAVNEIGPDPSRFTGTVKVAGVMRAVSPNERSVFGIVDVKDLKCSSPNCGTLIIPVRHQGQLPRVGDEVTVTGSFVKERGGYLLEAKNVKVVQHHKMKNPS